MYTAAKLKNIGLYICLASVSLNLELQSCIYFVCWYISNTVYISFKIFKIIPYTWLSIHYQGRPYIPCHSRLMLMFSWVVSIFNLWKKIKKWDRKDSAWFMFSINMEDSVEKVRVVFELTPSVGLFSWLSMGLLLTPTWIFLSQPGNPPGSGFIACHNTSNTICKYKLYIFKPPQNNWYKQWGCALPW